MSVDAVLCDRDGTLIVDVPHNGDPARVEPLATVDQGLRRLRAAGTRLAVVSNQSGIARGELTTAQVEQVMDRVTELLGPFDAVLWCPHGPDDRCHCRKPAPGLIEQAAARLGVAPERCGLIGDTAADIDAALGAGARPVLVPNHMTLIHEAIQAPAVAPTFAEAVEMLLVP